jgi:hypothetical protein
MYSNDHLYNRLTTCVVGRTWQPNFYDWIDDSQSREAMQQIAQETEEDYQILLTTLAKLNVKTLRPRVDIDLGNLKEKVLKDGFLPRPPMCPTDYAVMIGNNFFESLSTNPNAEYYNKMYQSVFENISIDNKITTVSNCSIADACAHQFNDQVFYSKENWQTHTEMSAFWNAASPGKKISGFHNAGHLDGWFCPVTPGLVISATDPVRPGLMNLFYKTHFKNSKIVYLPPTLLDDYRFQLWQQTNSGHWWVPGQENNLKFINLIDRHFKSWVGNISETVLDVNMIVIDSSTLIMRQTTNCQLIKQIENMGVTVYQVPFRHSVFWDGGPHCVTLALDRK